MIGACTGPIATAAGTRYDDLPPGRVDQVLREIESDPTGIFWG
jgi:hypothetical protein